LLQVARAAGVSLSTVELWVARAQRRPLDEVDWADRSSRPRRTRRTRREIEDRVIQVRQALKATSDLGEFGAVAIRTELLAQGEPGVPVVRTLGRILERRGVLDRRRRVRRPPPPPGWYLPAVAQHHAELDSANIVEGLHIRGGPDVEVLTVISRHGGLVGAWPTLRVTAKTVVDTSLAHWRAVGLPTYIPVR
jgi:transposase